MVRRELVINLVAGEPQPVDGELCPVCWLPSLFTIPVHAFCSHGVIDAGRLTACTTETCREVTR